MTTPFRPGSTGHLASQQLEINGPMTTAALAAAIDKPEDELQAMLAFPVRLDLLRHDPVTDLWSLGDGTRRQPDPPPAPKPPAPPPIQRHVVPPAVRELPPAAPPKPALKPTRAQQVKRALNVAAINRPDQASGVDIDAVYRPPAPPLASPPAPAQLDQVPVFLEHKPGAVPVANPLRLALWSDGTLNIERGAERMAFTVDEVRHIVAYLERLAA